MKKKKAGSIIILFVFINVICLSWFWRIMLSDFTDTENHEKRKPAAKPAFTLKGYKTYADEYTDYFNDALPFRNELITLNNMIDFTVFKKSPVPDVIIGKDHWLFYARKEMSDPVENYKGTNLYSEKELKAFAKNCLRQRDFLRGMGKEFIIFIAPNKERMYPEYMPSWYGRPAKNYKVLQIVNYLKNHTDLRVIYPYDELMETKKKLKQPIFYKTDTHWNYIGGYAASRVLLKELGISLPAIDSEKITIRDTGEMLGDLGDMLNLGDGFTYRDREYRVEGYDTHNMEEIEADFSTVYRYHANNADPRKIYMVRDSFAYHMGPYIGSQFRDSCLRHIYNYSYKEFKKEDPDIFVYETVERYVDNLKTFSMK